MGRDRRYEDTSWVPDLLRAILLRSLQDLIVTSDYSKSSEWARIGPEVRHWFCSDRVHLFSFRYICDMLNLEHSWIRQLIRPYLLAENMHLADFTLLQDRMTSDEKASFVESKVYKLGPCGIRVILTACRPVLQKSETLSYLSGLIATGQVRTSLFSRGRGRNKGIIYLHKTVQDYFEESELCDSYPQGYPQAVRVAEKKTDGTELAFIHPDCGYIRS